MKEERKGKRERKKDFGKEISVVTPFTLSKDFLGKEKKEEKVESERINNLKFVILEQNTLMRRGKDLETGSP